MSRFKRITAGLTALALSLSLSACGANTRTALTVDGYEVPAGVYIYYLNTAYSNAVSQLSQENSELDTTDKEAIKNMTLEGKDITTWVQDKATEMVTDFVATEKKFDELGLSLDADAKSNISMMKDYYWASSQETFEANGISEESFTKIITSSYKSDEIFMYYYGIDGENGVTEDDLKQYYIDNNIRAQFINVSLKDSEGNLLKSDGKAEMMELLEGYRDRVQAAYDEGGEDAAREEMDAVTDEYNAYLAAQEEAEEEADSETSADDETTAEDEDSETSADDETTAEDEDSENSADDETTAEDGETSEVEDDALSAPKIQQILTAENDVDAEDSSADEEIVADEETAQEAETSAENENDVSEEEDETTAEDADSESEEAETSAEDENAEEEEKADFVPDYDTEFEDSLPEDEESAEDEETAVASDEDGADDTADIGGDADIPTYPNETIINVINPDDYDDPSSIYYNPSEKVYNQLVGIKEADYGKPYIVEEDENYYLVVRYDITERMTDTDLWTETTINNVDYQAHSKDFEDLLDSWTSTASVSKNQAAYKRYDPFKLTF